MQLTEQNACLACIKPWVHVSALHQMGVAVYAWDPRTGEVEAERKRKKGKGKGRKKTCNFLSFSLSFFFADF